MSEPNENKQIDIWLSEYRACHLNRNHYESVKWSIGSILLVGSFTLFGISFWEEVSNNKIEVLLLAVFSILLMLIWLSYVYYVGSYISKSLYRVFEIEKKLEELEYDIKLHTSIRSERRILRGRYITHSFIFIVIFAWIIRLFLFYVNMVT